MKSVPWSPGPLRLAALFLLACSGSGSSVDGTLVSIYAGQVVPSNPAISVTGRSGDAISVEIGEGSSGSQTLPFRVNGLTRGESYLFRVSDAALDTVFSFPYLAGGAEILQLAAVPLGTVARIQEAAVEAGLATSVDPNLGTILGQVDPTGQPGLCSTVSAVQLLDASGAAAAQSDPPIYFSADGSELLSSGMGDAQCSYAILNVTPGEYRIRFLGPTLNSVGEHQVIAIAGSTSFGFDIP